jgi:predicted heme/steroid binding protein
VVSELVRSGLAEGATIQEMQTAIIKSRAFSPARALTIARTETTRSVNKGTVESYRAALPEVPDLKMQWLTARDDGERHPSYVNLDGQVAEVDGEFTLYDGDHAGTSGAHPGGFGIASEDINCRCTTIPYFASESA